MLQKIMIYIIRSNSVRKYPFGPAYGAEAGRFRAKPDGAARSGSGNWGRG
jgi:hypothetical protein